MNNILVSVVIVNCNAKNYLSECISSLLNCNYKNIEIIVVDNGSNDGSWEFLEDLSRSERRLRLARNHTNIGLSIARKQGFRLTKGKYIAFIDNDTCVDQFWLDKSIPLFESNPLIGACQCKLLIKEGVDYLDCVGEYLGRFGFLVHPVNSGEEVDRGQYDYIKEILSPKGAGMIIRRGALEKIGDFDEDYFIYLDETDACWRIWLAGYKIIFIPDSRIYHRSGTTEIVLPEMIDYLVKFHGTKNYIMTLIKNLGTKNLIKILPAHLFIWICVALYFLCRGKVKSFRLIVMGISWNAAHLNSLLKKRSQVQKERKVKDVDIFAMISKKENLLDRVRDFINPKKPAGHATTWDKGE